MVVEVALARKIQDQIQAPSLVCCTNRGKVELQDDRRSVSTLQSAVEHTRARRKKLRFHGKYEAYNFGKKGLAGPNVQMVENTL